MTTPAVAEKPAASEKTGFQGWPAMRLVNDTATTDNFAIGDVNGDGTDEIIFADTQRSRLLVFRWLPKDQRKPVTTEEENPNVLPLSPEISRQPVPLDDLPFQLMIHDLDGDGQSELLVLTLNPNRLQIMKATVGEDGEWSWEVTQKHDLLDGNFATASKPMLVRKGKENKTELLISMANGIQVLDLGDKEARGDWLTPRDEVSRMDWWLVDLDQDGDKDLVEFRSPGSQALWWMENIDGRLGVSHLLTDVSLNRAAIVKQAEGAGQVVALPTTPQGQLRRYTLGVGEQSPLGSRRTLPMPGATGKQWAGLLVDGKPCVVYVDPNQPRLVMHELTKDGWGEEKSYPGINEVQTVIAPAAKPGLLLMHARDEATLHSSEWDGKRLSYPKPWQPKDVSLDAGKILTLQQVGQVTWWAQKNKDENALFLYVWKPGDDQPSISVFSDVGNIDKVQWLGGQRLLVMEQYARNGKILSLNDGKVVTSEPTHLERLSIDEYMLLDVAGELKLARKTSGVLQWLDENLQATDQVMLDGGSAMASFLPIDKNSAWALQVGGKRVHLLVAGDDGLMRMKKIYEIDSVAALKHDPVLGKLLIEGRSISAVAPGKPVELTLQDSLDAVPERRTNLDQVSVNRFFATDVTGDGNEDVLLVDDQKNYLTLVELNDKEMAKGMSWQVFETSSYPYGGGYASYGPQGPSDPREVVALDFDGDKKQDLLLLSQNRLLFYLGGKP